MSVIVAAHDEEGVIERRLENLLALDYPPDRVEIVVASDASTDGPTSIVERVAEREPRVRLLRCERGGKVAAQNRAVRETNGEIVAFSDANATWAVPALRKLVRNFADPEVAYVCGQLRLEDADGTNREGAYWRYEAGCARRSRPCSVTGGNGSIYAVRRVDYEEVDPRFGHDLSLPYLMVQRGRRAVYEAEAIAFEKPTPTSRTSTAARCGCSSTAGRSCSRAGCCAASIPSTATELVSHRHLRYASGVLHLAALASNVALLRRGLLYRALFAGQLAFLGLGRRPPRAPALLRPRDLGDGRGAGWLSSLRRAGGLGESGGDEVTETAIQVWQELACPRDRSRLEPRGETLVCEQGHEYPFPDGIPVARRRRAGADAARLLVVAGADRACAPPSRRRSRASRSTRTSPS